MTKVDIEGVREAWLRDMSAEARLWLAHIDRRVQEIVDSSKVEGYPLFEIGELLFNVFSYLNWLARVHLREENYVKGKGMITFLGELTHWPVEACEAFWFCIRNPVMHTGRASAFDDHGRKSSDGWNLAADLHPNLAFDPAEFDPEHFGVAAQDGCFAVADPDTPGRVIFTYFFPGVRRKLEDALNIVVTGIENADHESVRELYKINVKNLAFRVSGVSE